MTSLFTLTLSSLRGTLWVVLMTLLFATAIACFWLVGVETALLSKASVTEPPKAETLELVSLKGETPYALMGLKPGDQIVSMANTPDFTTLSIVRENEPLRIEYRTSEQ